MDGGGGSGSQRYNYNGTVVCWIGQGPAAELVAVIVDNRVAWPAAKAWVAGSYTAGKIVFYAGRFYVAGSTTSAEPPAAPWALYSLTVAAANGSGYTPITLEGITSADKPMRFYWGLPNQVADPFLTSTANTLVHDAETGQVHPPYPNTIYAVLEDAFLGQERASAPNIRFLLRRASAQTLITGDPATLDDANVNVMAFLAELFTSSTGGLGMSSARLHEESWRAVAATLHAQKNLTAISPVLRERQSVRAVIGDLAGYTDIWLRYNPDSDQIEAGVWTHGAAPDSPTVLAADQWKAAPKIRPTSWAKAMTQAQVQFTDRSGLFKSVPEFVPDPRARRIVREDRPQTLSRPYITRREQARAHGAEWLRSRGRTPATVTLLVRRSVGLGILPGDWIRPDLDPEPGGAELLIFLRVLSRTIPPLTADGSPDITLECEADETQAPLLYLPTPGGSEFTQPTPPPAITSFRLVEAPVKLAGGSIARVWALMQRPSSTIIGADVWFDSTGETADLQRIGRQQFFAVKASLAADLAADADSDADELVIEATPADSVLRLTVAAQVDSQVLNNAPPGPVAANDDTLLLILIEVDSGAVAEDGSGIAQIEVLSVSDWEVDDDGNFAIHALRARGGTAKHPFTAAGAEAWLIRRDALTAVAHADFTLLKANHAADIDPQAGTFRLQPLTRQAIRSLDDCDDITFAWPKSTPSRPTLTLEAPGETAFPYTFATDAGGTIRLTGRFLDSDLNMTSLSVMLTAPDGTVTPLLNQTLALSGEAPFDVSQNCNASGTWRFTISAVDADGLAAQTILEVVVPAAAGQVATPTASPPGAPLGSYVGGPTVPVTLSCATAGATIYYRYDNIGGSGGGSWSTYTGPVTVASPGRGAGRRLFAYASHSGMADSVEAFWDFPWTGR